MLITPSSPRNIIAMLTTSWCPSNLLSNCIFPGPVAVPGNGLISAAIKETTEDRLNGPNQPQTVLRGAGLSPIRLVRGKENRRSSSVENGMKWNWTGATRWTSDWEREAVVDFVAMQATAIFFLPSLVLLLFFFQFIPFFCPLLYFRSLHSLIESVMMINVYGRQMVCRQETIVRED